MAHITKGVVLAAGLGTRLRPLTDRIPKPLMPFLCGNLLDCALQRLKRVGVSELAVNGHHLHEQIRAHLAQRHPEALFSHEQTLLGTGGVYPHLAAFLGDSDFIVANGDVLTDFDIAGAIAQHRAHSPFATMVLSRTPLPGKNPVLVKDGRVVGWGKVQVPGIDARDTTPHTFLCTQILSHKMIAKLPREGASEIALAYSDAFTKNEPVLAHIVDAEFWHDLGDPLSFWNCYRDIFARLGNGAGREELCALLSRVGLFESNAHARIYLEQTVVNAAERVIAESPISKTAQVGPNVYIGKNCSIGENARLDNAVAFPNSQIATGKEISGQIFADGLTVAFAHKS